VDVFEAITERRMLPRVTEEPPSREQIERLLELAVRAPNHHRTEPWRFYVVQGGERERLARAIADEAVSTGAEGDRALTDARAKVARAPVIVVFTAAASDDPKVIEQEEIASVAMAMQNFLLGAYAMGLGAMLRTGPAAYHAAIRDHLGLAPNERVVGFVYLGNPAADRALTERRSAPELTTWLG
jgi:nitroreductase